MNGKRLVDTSGRQRRHLQLPITILRRNSIFLCGCVRIQTQEWEMVHLQPRARTSPQILAISSQNDSELRLYVLAP